MKAFICLLETSLQASAICVLRPFTLFLTTEQNFSIGFDSDE